jgi:Family of unknown function (DUF6527)
MKSMVRHILDHGVRYDALAFICPGCEVMFPGSTGLHMLPVNTTEHSPSWTWDGNLEQPTLSPSILTGRGTDKTCHSFLRSGVLEFLSDCTHPLAGTSAPLPDLPQWFTEEDE